MGMKQNKGRKSVNAPIRHPGPQTGRTFSKFAPIKLASFELYRNDMPKRLVKQLYWHAQT
jgi:hypothetical protein